MLKDILAATKLALKVTLFLIAFVLACLGLIQVGKLLTVIVTPILSVIIVVFLLLTVAAYLDKKYKNTK